MKIKEAVNEILRSTWARDISADNAADEIEALFFHAGELVQDDYGNWYAALDENLIDEFEDGKNVFIVADD